MDKGKPTKSGYQATKKARSKVRLDLKDIFNSSKTKRTFFLIFQTCFDGTSLIVSGTVMKTSVEFYSAQVTMGTLHDVTEYYVKWIQSYNGARMHVYLTKMTVGEGACKESLNYKLAKFVSNLLQPHIPSEHVASNTASHLFVINRFSMEGKYMVSFDVESLFTHLSLDERIDLVDNFINKGNQGFKLSASDLKRLFSLFATTETLFLFKGTFYDQIDGVAMGSP